MFRKFFVFLLLSTRLSAQNVSISDNPAATPDASAMLDVQSTAKGMLAPRMTSAQRTAINNPALGLLIFDTSTESFWFREGSGWQEIGGGNAWEVKGGTIYTTDKNVAIRGDSATQALQVNGNIRIQEKQAFNGNDGGILMYDQNGVERVHLNKIYSGTGTNFRVEVKTPDTANGSASVQFFRNTIAKTKLIQICQGKGNSFVSAQIGADGQNSYFQADGGNFGIGVSNPLFKLDVDGVPAANQVNWDIRSDLRVKTNITPISNALTLLGRLNPVTFNWKKEYADTRNGLRNLNYGFIAQEVEAILPESVTKVAENINGVTIEDFRLLNSDAFVPLLVKSVQEQQQDMNAQKTVIENQDIKIRILQNQLTDMKNQVQDALREIENLKRQMSKTDEGK